MDLLLLGYDRPGQMGNYLAAGAERLGLDYRIMDLTESETNNRYLQKFFWRFRGKRPANWKRFASQALETCATLKPTIVLTTGGRVPLERSHVERLRDTGIKVINYSTDDPWNPALYARWFVAALPVYDAVFTPRRANILELRQCGVRDVQYLPFGYDPIIHRAWEENSPSGKQSDVLFVGACDSERLPMISALADAGLNLALYGRYWDDHSKTAAHSRGVANQDTIRAASASAAVCLCLVRRGNRDGHVMRSFEAAAIGGCILAEDTEDHRELFGENADSALYFRTTPELVEGAKRLVADPQTRRGMSLRLRERMAARADTYADRLSTMLCHMKVANSSY
jgi:spore maturation protein CgeB